MENNKSTTGIIIFFLIMLIAFTTFIFIRERSKIEAVAFDYNGFDVQRVDSGALPLYRIQIFINQGQEAFFITMRHDPRTIEDITIERNLKDKILKKELFVTMEPNATGLSVIAGTEISKIIGSPFLFNVPTHGALLRDAGNNAPVRTCADVNETTSIIKLQIGNDNRIFSEGDCVVVEANSEANLTRAADRLALTVLGVMKG